MTLSRLDLRNRSHILTNVQTSWIAGVLDQPPYTTNRIDLHWACTLEHQSATLIEVFDAAHGHLLILGAPGVTLSIILPFWQKYAFIF